MQKTKCEKCVDLCIKSGQVNTAQQSLNSTAPDVQNDLNGTAEKDELVPQGTFFAPDIVQAPELRISPNPTSGDWQIRYNVMEGGPAFISIFDATGKLLETREVNLKIGANLLNQPVQSLAPGVYFMEIKSNQFVAREKVIKL